MSKYFARREFLRQGSIGAAALLAGSSRVATAGPAKVISLAGNPGGTACPDSASVRIKSASLGKPIRYPESHGDTWTATWADDDNIYATSDDTQGFDKGANSNLALNRITGNMPPDIHGVTVNPMKEYGGWGEVRKDDGAMWKACGLASVDGVLYMSVSRNMNPDYAPWIQQTWDATIIKSSDHGKTWSTAPPLNHSMFPGRVFSTPFFVDYGKDGRGTKDGSDRYVYATSNDGAWNNGNWMTLGRVRRDLLPRLDPRDWEFVHGYDGKGGVVWQPRWESAVATFYNPGRTSMAPINYIAPLDVYILSQWYYTRLDDPARRWKATRFEFYHAPAPWGPWTLFHAQDFEPEGWYNPSIPSKYISADGKSMWTFVAGDWTDAETTHGLYGLWMMPLQLEVEHVSKP